MVTLRILVTGADGRPAPFGSLLVVNTDDYRRFSGFPVIVNGEARISAPAGHYAFLVEAGDIAPNFADRLLNISDSLLSAPPTPPLDIPTATAPRHAHTP